MGEYVMDKTIKEQIAILFNEPDRVNFRKLLQNITGEYDVLDFKGQYIEDSKLAKHILAMANSGSGVIIFGITEEDNIIDIKGLEELKDKTDIKNKLEGYLPYELKYEIHDLEYDDSSEWKAIRNKKFQFITIEETLDKIPFLSKKEGKNLRPNTVYCRKNSSSDEASHDDLQEILNKRINYSIGNDDLQNDLEQLETIYSFLSLPKQFYYKTMNPDFLSTLYKIKNKKISIILDKIK